MKSNKKKGGYTIEWPFNLMSLLFVIEIFLVGGIFFFMGGLNFFNQNNLSSIPIISLGLLTFVSIFFAFVSKEEEFEKAFREVIKKHENKFQEELEKNSKEKVNPKFLKDFQRRYNSFKTYKNLVNSVLWLYISIFLGLITLLVYFADMQFKLIFLSAMIHLQILSAFLLITSIISVYLANIFFKKSDKIPLVECKIGSILPGTVVYDLIDSGKIWFQISNKENKKYKAYISIEFISENYHEQIVGGYYGGRKEWNLNAFASIHAPGIPISSKIIEMAKKGKKIEVKIDCTIKGENNNLIEKKLPVKYIYNKETKSWCFTP